MAPEDQDPGRAGRFAEPDPPSTFSFHPAFDDPTTSLGAPDRTSIEVRCVAVG